MVARDSPIESVVGIGHTNVSHSFIPDIADLPETEAKAIDCPGFFDNRGTEINIANAVNIKAMAAASTLSLIHI